jgi:hypothetical protein
MFRFTILLAALLILPATNAMSDGAVACTGELAEVAEAFRVELQEMEELIKVSTVENQIGIEPSTTFDLANHSCHNIPGQAYRIYTEGVCETQEELLAVVRYDYKLFYRRAETINEMFKRPFEEGTAGILQVKFEQTGQGWRMLSRRERLWIGDADKKRDHEKNPPQ